MSDDGILDHLRNAYFAEAAFAALKIKERKAGQLKLVQDAPEPRGEIELEVRKASSF